MEVTLIDTFGDDLTVVNAARVSFGKEVTEMTTRDEKLIKYLADHSHVTPFFHPQVRFARNELSRRYVESVPEIWSPAFLRERDSNKKQGSKDSPIANNEECMALIKDHHMECLDLYNNLLIKGVCPEQARIILPQSMMTEFIETGSLAAYARLYKLRTDPTAQREIQDLANTVGIAIEKHFPVSWKALTA